MVDPITPPQELVNHWRIQAPVVRDGGAIREQWIATQAARWGDDQRLMACCDLVEDAGYPALAARMRSAFRPKPLSLKEQALAALKRQSTRSVPSLVATQDCDTIRRALEALSDD